MDIDEHATIPLAWVGPVRITGNAATDELDVPLATFETPLWPSVRRGARLSRLTDQGIRATLIDDRMSRSVLLEADNADAAYRVARLLHGRFEELRKVVTTTSRYAELIDMHHQIAGNLLFLRFEFTTGDAAGHNMTTQAGDRLLTWILAEYPELRYGSVSGNFCTDKKTSAVNGILGRGKNVVAEIIVPRREVDRRLHTTAERIATLNTRKNLLGTVLAGGVRTANAHYANMLLAFYLATGQDAANIVEGSQGITYAEDRDGDLYFSCTIPNLVVGTVGNGKHHPFVDDALRRLGCREPRPAGENARRLAAIAAAVVLCGELSLLAALTSPGELMRAHTRLERHSA
ncbi:hydroxymethylglutaryl-CoA reductase [Nocardia rhamnosiphila]